MPFPFKAPQGEVLSRTGLSEHQPLILIIDIKDIIIDAKRRLLSRGYMPDNVEDNFIDMLQHIAVAEHSFSDDIINGIRLSIGHVEEDTFYVYFKEIFYRLVSFAEKNLNVDGIEYLEAELVTIDQWSASFGIVNYK